jgi:CDP-glucose 4,6-dehydratase
LRKLDKSFWKSKNVLVTGHSGFKGKWLCTLLKELKSNIFGISKKNSKGLNFVTSYKSDLNNINKIAKYIKRVKPEIVFHLAAQPIVSVSYKDPKRTFKDNIFGLLNILEILRKERNIKAIVIVTSDKCYKLDQKNSKILTETSALGGNDPYSASKSCAEIISHCYLKSFFLKKKIGLATARAGNVIGGNDFAQNRIIPDLVRAKKTNKNIYIRNPNSSRPWQHVIDVIYGYCLLAENLYKNPKDFSGPWNFAKEEKKQTKVLDIAKIFLKEINYKKKINFYKEIFHEEKKYVLSSQKSKKKLGWKPIYNKNDIIIETAKWYNDYLYDSKNSNSLFKKYLLKYLHHLN